MSLTAMMTVHGDQAGSINWLPELYPVAIFRRIAADRGRDAVKLGNGDTYDGAKESCGHRKAGRSVNKRDEVCSMYLSSRIEGE